MASISLSGITANDVPIIDVNLSSDVDAAVLELESF